MKTSSLLGLALALGFALAPARAATSIEAMVIAQSNVPPVVGHKVYYAVIDGGLIEAGEIVAGESAPTPGELAATLRSSLATRGYLPCDQAHPAEVLLTYFWGVLRPDSGPNLPRVATSFNDSGIHSTWPNHRARLRMVAPEAMVERVLDALNVNKAVSFPEVRDTLSYAHGSRYFVVVCAYDFHSLSERKRNLFWRVRLSAYENEGSMREVVLALAAGGAPYWGTDDPGRILFSVDAPDLKSTPPESPVYTSEALSQPSVLDGTFLRTLMERDYLDVSGEPTRRFRQLAVTIPPDLKKQIAEYNKEKSDLQAALTSEISRIPAGQDPGPTIDAYSAKNATRLGVLRTQRESIRNQLATLKAHQPDTPQDGALEAILREFAADVQTWSPNAGLGH